MKKLTLQIPPIKASVQASAPQEHGYTITYEYQNTSSPNTLVAFSSSPPTPRSWEGSVTY